MPKATLIPVLSDVPLFLQKISSARNFPDTVSAGHEVFEKNRIQNCMTVSNVGIASILSDPFGKTATEIISYLLDILPIPWMKKLSKLIKKGANQV